MCRTCGCSGAELHGPPAPDPGRHDHGPHDHGPHDHGPPDHGPHDHGPSPLAPPRAPRDVEPRALRLELDLLDKNDRFAKETRALFARVGAVALNVMGAPGAGKTALLEATLRRLDGRLPVAVLEGDQETENDAARIRTTGCPVVQINTGAGCHLDATMVLAALKELPLAERSLLFIENVGNLVCPALFDLGERAKVVVLSTTEGEDKPLKYPHMFRAADVLVLNKIDLAPHVGFDEATCVANALRVKPSLRVFRVSATKESGLDDWCEWLLEQAEPARPRGAARA